jgi:hypothetical protein
VGPRIQHAIGVMRPIAFAVSRGRNEGGSEANEKESHEVPANTYSDYLQRMRRQGGYVYRSFSRK